MSDARNESGPDRRGLGMVRSARLAVRAGERFAILVVAILLVHVVVDVTVRYLTGGGLDSTIEFVAKWWMPALTFAALGAVELTGRQIEASFLRDRLDARTSRIARRLSAALTIFVCLAMGITGFIAAWGHMGRGEAALGSLAFPIWPARFLVPFGLLVLLLGVIVRTLESDDDERRPPNWGIE